MTEHGGSRMEGPLLPEQEAAQHTPGPWMLELDKWHDGWHQITAPNPDAGKTGVCYAGDRLIICQLDSEADARLIAAAPALLEALEETLVAYCTLRLRLLKDNQVEIEAEETAP